MGTRQEVRLGASGPRCRLEASRLRNWGLAGSMLSPAWELQEEHRMNSLLKKS